MVLGCPTPGGSVGTLSSYKFHLGCHPAVEGVSPHAEMGQQFLGGAELINARASVLLPLLSSRKGISIYFSFTNFMFIT